MITLDNLMNILTIKGRVRFDITGNEKAVPVLCSIEVEPNEVVFKLTRGIQQMSYLSLSDIRLNTHDKSAVQYKPKNNQPIKDTVKALEVDGKNLIISLE